jgi:hypothetical protein
MHTWFELINGPIRSEMLQLELLCREVIESLPAVIIYAVPILFCTVWLLVALDCMLAEGKDMPQSIDQHKITERCYGSFRDRSSQPATRLLQKDSAAAA